MGQSINISFLALMKILRRNHDTVQIAPYVRENVITIHGMSGSFQNRDRIVYDLGSQSVLENNSEDWQFLIRDYVVQSRRKQK